MLPSAISLLPTLRSFRVLRVLDLQGCDLSKGYRLKYVEKLFHLRYLGLGDTRIAQLPEETGNIRFLQTLDLMGTCICSLPSTVVQLRHLMCLYIESYTRLPNGIGSLTSLVRCFVREARVIPSSDGGFGMGLGNLPSLQDVWVYLKCEGASNEEVKDLKVALRNSVEINPNHPKLHIYWWIELDMRMNMKVRDPRSFFPYFHLSRSIWPQFLLLFLSWWTENERQEKLLKMDRAPEENICKHAYPQASRRRASASLRRKSTFSFCAMNLDHNITKLICFLFWVQTDL